MTLIELVVAIAVMGGIATVLAAAVTVTFRQQAGTEASVNVARWEQSLALWFPPDLASANPDPVYHPVTNPFPITGADTTDDGNVQPTPCGATVCGGYDFGNGSNVLMLGWNDGSQQIVVSYRYGPAADGDGFVLTRVQCIDGTCAARVVLRDLAPPVDAGWVPGDSVPASVVDVVVEVIGGQAGRATPWPGCRNTRYRAVACCA